METTTKSLKQQIKEVHDLFDKSYLEASDKTDAIHEHCKEIIEHVMKLEYRLYFVEKKLSLGLTPF